MLIDTHCHLGDPKFDGDRVEVILRAREAGVDHIVVIADSAESADLAIALAGEFGLSATAGVHPHVASKWSDTTMAKIKQWVAEEKVVAIGEIGLDYHYDFSPRDVQRAVFRRQLELAEEANLPAVIHSRSADSDMAAMIRDSRATIVMHSFSSGPEVLTAGMDRDAYVSFSGMITFRSWSDVEAVRVVSGNRLLVETDSPYLAPVPHRGKRNEPAFVVEIAKRLAEMRDMSYEEISLSTTENAIRCFGMRIDN